MPDTLDDLLRSPDFGKAIPQVQESVLRKFVAAQPDDCLAWMALLRLLARHESWRELARLGMVAARRFPGEPNAWYLAATGLANIPDINQALATLARGGATLDAFLPAHHLAGDLLLAADPARAAGLFRGLLQHNRDDLRARLGAASAESLLHGRRGADVVFFQPVTWHVSIQEPIFHELTSRGVGCAMTSQTWLIPTLRPKVVVVSDVPRDAIRRIRHSLPATRIVNTRHGLGDKNYAYHASTIVDYVCASSEQVARTQIHSGLIDPAAVWVTGFPQMDDLFRERGRPSLHRSGSPKHILFAPTFTRDLNSGELIGEDPVAALRGDRREWHVTVRPHPNMINSHPGLLGAWQHSMKAAMNVTLDLNFERSPAELLCSADLLVSDVSSMALQFLALDRPIVCLMQDDRAARSPFFAEDSYELRLTRAALKVARKEDLAEAVRRSIESGQPDSVAVERRALGNELFGDLRDGGAAVRVARKIEAILDGAAS